MTTIDYSDPGGSGSAETRWGRVLEARGAKWSEALTELAASYYYCAYAWWRRTGLEPADAAEATVAAFSIWLEKERPSAEQSGAKSMREWMAQRLPELLDKAGEMPEVEDTRAIEVDREWAESRYADEPPGAADVIFHRRWGLTVLEFSVTTLRAEYAARGEEELFAALLPFAGFENGQDNRYEEAAAGLGLTIGAMRKRVFDFRQRQRELLLDFAADTLADPDAASDEIMALLCACDPAGTEAAQARLPSAIGNLQPEELLARAMKSVRMTGGGLANWKAPTPEEAARLFPQYEVTSLIGRGGMGAVYQGRQIELDRAVAIKLLPLEVSVDRDFAERFRREARAMAKLRHPNIIDVHDFGTTAEGHLYFVMEYVEGANLEQMIKGAGLTPVQTFEVITKVCDALAYAHAEGVVHRDIKPANVMVSKKGKVKVADFGLARLIESELEPQPQGRTITGTVLGTPDYMAPEQKRGLVVDHRADIYSLGVMLYEMLCNEVPQGVFDLPSKRVDVDVRVDEVVIKAMQQQPERRFQTSLEMKSAVTAARTPLPLVVRANRAPAVIAHERALLAEQQKSRPIAAVLSLLAILGTGVLLYCYYFKKDALDRQLATIVSKTTGKPVQVGSAGGATAPTGTAAATKGAPFENGLGMKFVPVPIIGGPTGGQRVLFSIWDTRVQDYTVFARDANRVWPPANFEQGPTHPAVNVSWEDAVAFCAWLTTRERAAGRLGAKDEVRLPTDHEWSCAVGIGEQEDPAQPASEKSAKIKDVYPWGTGWPPPDNVANYRSEELNEAIAANKVTGVKPAGSSYHDGFGMTSPVGSYAPNRFGLYDMGGNVWQWCMDAVDDRRIMRGAHWSDYGPLALSSTRVAHPVKGPATCNGFRCVIAPPSPAPPSPAPPSPAPPSSAPAVTRVAPTPALAAGPAVGPARDAPFVNSLGMKFVPVPAAGVLFCIHETRFKDYAPYKEDPGTDKALAKGVTMSPKDRPDDHPVVFVSYADAQAYCTWLSRKEGRTYRLPTDREWSLAAGLDEQWYADTTPASVAKDSSQFPWGTTWPPPAGVGNYADESMRLKAPRDRVTYVADYDDGFAASAPVMSFTPNKLGLYDMGGNAQEWVEDWVDQKQERRAVRGASFIRGSRGELLSSNRFGGLPGAEEHLSHDGFRVVLEPPGFKPFVPPPAPTLTQAPPAPAPPAAPVPKPPSISSWTSTTALANTLGMRFAAVPIVGGPTEGKRVLFSVWDTRVQDYAVFVKETKREWLGADYEQGPTHPVADITWEDAQAFCQWLTQREQKAGKLAPTESYRLPSDHEWSCAIGIGDREDPAKTPAEKRGKIADVYPWGTEWPPPAKAGNYAGEELTPLLESKKYPWEIVPLAGYNDGYPTTSPVGVFPPNRFGLYDMSGNVWQFCEDWLDATQKGRVLRGASWNNSTKGEILSSKRHFRPPSERLGASGIFSVGFRCVLTAEPAKAQSQIEQWFTDASGPQQDAYEKQAAQPFEAGLAALRGRYVAALDAATAKASAANQLDEALAWRAEKQSFAEAQTVGEDSPTLSPRIAALRATFRQDVARLDAARLATARALFAPFEAALAKNQALLTQRNRLDDALFLQQRRDELAKLWLAPSPLVPAGLEQAAEVAKSAPASAGGAVPAGVSKEKPFINSLEMKFVPIPSRNGTLSGERVLISIWDTRVQDYEVFAKETKRVWSKPSWAQGPTHPAVHISWLDAQAFCGWLTTRDQQAGLIGTKDVYRLPTDLEWSRAVGLPPEQGATPLERGEKNMTDFPWGRGFPPKGLVGNYRDQAWAKEHPDVGGLANYNDGFATTSPVGAFPANHYGLFDMGGNVWQWCDDWVDKNQKERVLRGAAFDTFSIPDWLRSARRHSRPPASPTPTIGFRCVLGVSGR